MFAADAELEVGSRRPAPLRRHPDQLADPLYIEADERVPGVDALFDIRTEKARGVVAADAQRGLGQVVGAEREELGRVRDVAGAQRGAGQLDHRADEIVDRRAAFGKDGGGDAIHHRLHQLQLALRRDERDHDFRDGRVAPGRDVERGLEDRARLHLIDLGIGDAQPAAAMAEHRIELVQLGGAAAQRLDLQPGRGGDIGEFAFLVRQELVQRRVEQADGDGQPRHHLEDRGEVAALLGQQLVERDPAALFVGREDHLAHRGDARGVEEHMLGAAQADPLRAELTRGAGVVGCVGVGADLQAANLIGPAHQRAEVARQLGLHGRHRARHHLTGRAVDGERVALADLTPRNPHHLVLRRDGERAGA